MKGYEDYSHEVYERTLKSLIRRSKLPEFSLSEIEGEFKSLKVYEGLGWFGRNAHKDAEIEGQIDAYQVFLYRMKNGEYQA